MTRLSPSPDAPHTDHLAGGGRTSRRPRALGRPPRHPSRQIGRRPQTQGGSESHGRTAKTGDRPRRRPVRAGRDAGACRKHRSARGDETGSGGGFSPTTFPSCDLQPGGDFAVSATDDGHVAAGFDALWAATDEQERIDFGTRAVHVVSVASKAIIAGFYGTGPRRSYFNGCSDGGREALQEAQRFPADFDGIVAGAPANVWAPLNGEFQPWLAAINSDAQGNSILTPAKLPALHSAAIVSCDGADGLVH